MASESETFDLQKINLRTVTDPAEFVAACDADYNARVDAAADAIAAHRAQSPIVLLSGPSGSGKTTTAQKVKDALEKKGVRAWSVSMDNYYCTLDPATVPRTEDGDMDLESPLCLDIPLLNEQFSAISRGEHVFVPKFEFARHIRSTGYSMELKAGKDEVVIFEGIHAFNGEITSKHPEAFKLYISARSDVVFDGRVVFTGPWTRLMRRTVRDYQFRSWNPSDTIRMWANVRRGEKLYISPYKQQADWTINTSFQYEFAAMNRLATRLFASIPEGVERYEELRAILPAIQLFGEIDEKYIAPDAMIREFIGGGIYER